MFKRLKYGQEIGFFYLFIFKFWDLSYKEKNINRTKLHSQILKFNIYIPKLALVNHTGLQVTFVVRTECVHIDYLQKI